MKVHRDSSDEEFDEEEEEEDSEEEEQGELANFDNNHEEVKLVLVIRTDLGMTKGTHCTTFHTSLRPLKRTFS